MKEELTHHPFVLRSYTKAELVHLYLPTYSPKVAMRIFNKWLQHAPALWEGLQKSGANIYTKVYAPMQVKLIVEHLGIP